MIELVIDIINASKEAANNNEGDAGMTFNPFQMQKVKEKPNSPFVNTHLQKKYKVFMPGAKILCNKKTTQKQKLLRNYNS